MTIFVDWSQRNPEDHDDGHNNNDDDDDDHVKWLSSTECSLQNVSNKTNLPTVTRNLLSI